MRCRCTTSVRGVAAWLLCAASVRFYNALVRDVGMQRGRAVLSSETLIGGVVRGEVDHCCDQCFLAALVRGICMRSWCAAMVCGVSAQ